MAITVREAMQSRRGTKGDSSRSSLTYHVKGTADDSEAVAAAEDHAPDEHNGLRHKNTDIDAVFVDETNPGGSVWRVTVNYARERDIEPRTSEERISFTAGTVSRHVAHAWNLAAAQPCGAWDAFPAGNLINVTAKGGEYEVKGVDVDFPNFHKSKTVYLPPAYMSDSYEYLLAQMCGTVNASQWGPYPEGTSRIEQIRGGKRGDSDWELTFHWAVRPNRYGVDVGWDPATESYRAQVDIEGWQYVWTYYFPRPVEKELGDGQAVLVRKPHTVFVCDLVPKTDFYDLGIEP